MPARVVDASALAAVLFGEPAGQKVTKALGRGPVFAPTLLPYEVGSVCLKKIRRHSHRRTDLLASLELLHRLDIQEVEVPAGDATELAERTNLTVYDAAYLWLAASLDAELVTLDEALESAAKAL
jgi:predicted nucleic acid-binding protein